MRSIVLRLFVALPLIAGVATVAPIGVHAQSDYAASALPDSGKVLVIVKEVVKPGKDGAAHERTEMQYARAMAAGKSTDYYTGFAAISGEPRVLFLSSYSSLADWESHRKSMSPMLDAQLDKINEADGAVLDSTSTAVFLRRDSLSTNVKAAPAKAHYMEVGYFVVKPGHEHEFEEAAKLYLKDMQKGVPASHWTCYSSYYGQAEGTVYIFMTALASMTEADQEIMDMDKFAAAAGPTDLTNLSKAVAASVSVQMENLFRISPKLSYPSPGEVAADPAFWKVHSAPAKKPAPKPAQ